MEVKSVRCGRTSRLDRVIPHLIEIGINALAYPPHSFLAMPVTSMTAGTVPLFSIQ